MWLNVCPSAQIMKTIRNGLLTLLVMIGGVAAHAQVVWTFTSGTGAADSLPPNITGGIITASNFGGGSLAFNSTSASPTPAFSGSNNAAVNAKSGSLDPSSSTYFDFTLTPGVDQHIRATGFSLGSRSTATGPTSLSLYTSIDGFTALVASVSTTANSTWASVTLSSFTVTGAAGSAVTFRLYGSGGTGIGTGNWRVDDLSLAATAVPEPSTYAALFGAVVLAGTLMRRQLRHRGWTAST
jgi:hypothetical protein